MIRDILQSEVKNALRAVSISADVTNIEVKKSEHFDDYASNIPLILAKTENKNPLDIGEEIKKELLKSPTAEKYIKEIHIVKPGFLNVSVTNELIIKEGEALSEQLEKGFDFLKNNKINIEFISANPTGELHIGHGRGAFYGDVLSNILSYGGAKVTREFYINDSRESTQVKELGKTGLGTGEQYKTAELEVMIKEMNFAGFAPENVGFALAEKVQEHNKSFIGKILGIKFDVWYSEDKHIREEKRSEKTFEELKEKGFTYEKDGAVWLKTSEYGDDEDRVIIRSDKTPSYFLSDIAYHDEKVRRGDNIVIDVWGADHHGHVKRILAVKKMLGWKGELLVFVTQLVSLKEGGELKKMSKRTGNVIWLEGLVDELGIDVVRWFFAEKALGTHMEFDLELAREQSAKNPVYYVQYAHARINSIFDNTKNLSANKGSAEELLSGESARALALKVLEFPELVVDITKDYQVHKLTTYAHELASEFSSFYRDVRIIEDGKYNKEALELSVMTQKTIAQTLKLLGISAPERM